MSTEVVLSEVGIDPAALLAAFTGRAGGAGAIVSFTGLARPDGQDGFPVEALVLESYRGVTLTSLETIAAAAGDRFAIAGCLVVHRTGRIDAGEPVVFVAAAAQHRRAAFEAADYLMDRLKTEAVLWKREEGPLGRRWIEPRERDHEDAARWQENRL